MPWWIVFWWGVVLAAACGGIIVAKAIGLPLAAKNEARAAGGRCSANKSHHPRANDRSGSILSLLRIIAEDREYPANG